MKEGDPIVAFAYTDYGGDFFDVVAIEYFQENYPQNIVVERAAYSGKNAIVFGEPAREFLEATENYLLGFDDMESFYYEKVSEVEQSDFETFLSNIQKFDGYVVKKGALNWLLENRSGYYGITTQGLDFSEKDLIERLKAEGLIKKGKGYGDGGEVEDENEEGSDEYASGGMIEHGLKLGDVIVGFDSGEMSIIVENENDGNRYEVFLDKGLRKFKGAAEDMDDERYDDDDDDE
jgi:hypothetical protein